MKTAEQNNLEDALTECLYRALVESNDKTKEFFTDLAIKISGVLDDTAVERAKDYAVYRARNKRLHGNKQDQD